MIKVICAKQVVDKLTGAAIWDCWLELSDEGRMWGLQVSAPGDLAIEDLAGYFAPDELCLLQTAQDIGIPEEQVQCLVDFEDLAQQAVEEIQWLDDTIPTIQDPVAKRLAQENRQILKGMRYVIRRLK